MSKTTTDQRLDEEINNLILSGLTIEQMTSLPRWLLVNIENNKQKLMQAVRAERVILLNGLYDNRKLVVLKPGQSAYMVRANDIKQLIVAEKR